MTRVVILAAGKGTRMMSDVLPKVLHVLNGRPILDYILDAVKKSKVDSRPIVVVGFLAEKIIKIYAEKCVYAVQSSLRGTGDAVRSAKKEVGNAKNIIVLNGDMPFVSHESIQNTIRAHQAHSAVMTMGTVRVKDFNAWRKPFENFGRILRDKNENVIKITEAHDASADELAIKEVNPSVFCFDTDWLWKALDALTTENSQGEYYITDLLEQAISNGKNIATVPIEAKEAIGINTPEQLAFAEKMMNN